jgi:chemotaxis protein MotB
MTTWPKAALFSALGAITLAGCVTPNSDYDQLKARYEQSQAANRQLVSENQALQAQLAQQAQQTQQRLYTVAADVLFASGGFEIAPNGQAALNDIAARLRSLKNSKIVVYGYTDDQPVGPPLKKLGINSNMELSSKRAAVVADFLRNHGVNPNILSAKGRAETHPVAPNNTPAGRAQNRRIEIAVEGAGS